MTPGASSTQTSVPPRPARRLAALGVGLAVTAVGACAQPTDSGSRPSDPAETRFGVRAEALAQAWRQAGGAATWTTAFIPLQGLTVPSQGLRFDPETRQAFEAGWYRLGAVLPAPTPGSGKINYLDGAQQQVALVPAAAAFGQLDAGEPAGCLVPQLGLPGAGVASPQPSAANPTKPCAAALTVAAVRLGTVPLATSRGLADVPAWLFTIKELGGDVARVAVAPTAITAVPPLPTDEPDAADPAVAPPAATPGTSPPAATPTAASPVATPSGGQQSVVLPVDRLASVNGRAVAYEVAGSACDKNVRPVWHESGDVVVLGALADRDSGVCTKQLVLHKVSAELDGPATGRTLLDGGGGRLLVLTTTP
ncbi:hypothetical protein GCM10010201_22510 [Pilimelia columellifera subsp. columellifera]|uniref:Uncharacterized protein n=2 Tax=Pilimelia TaxID=53370 RepID=A0ABP6AU40_9ACTN